MNRLRNTALWMIETNKESDTTQGNTLTNDILVSLLIKTLKSTQLIENDVVSNTQTQLLEKIYQAIDQRPNSKLDNLSCIALDYIHTEGHSQDWGKVMAKIDTQLNNAFTQLTLNNNLGFMAGAAGVIYYLSNRKQKNETASEIFDKNFEVFIKAVKGVLSPEYLRKHPLDFTMCNGLTGALMVLLANHEYSAEIKEIVMDGCNLMLSLRQEVDITDNRFQFFPTGIQNQRPVFEDNAFWLANDLNQAFLLYRVSEVFDNKQFFDIAQLVGLHTLTMTNNEQKIAAEIGIENGLSNILWVYKSLYEIDPQPAYLKAREYWKEKMIQEINTTQDLSKGLIEAVLALALCESNQTIYQNQNMITLIDNH